MDPRFEGLAHRLPKGEPGDWSMAWKLRLLAASFQQGTIVAEDWPEGDEVQVDLLDIADWIEEAARRLSR